jgi:hypothetical protein
MRRVVGAAIAFAVAMTAAPVAAQVTDRQRAEMHFDRARSYVQEGRCDLAIEEFRRSIDYEPTSVGARLNLGDCYVLLGRLPEAFRQYKMAEANAVVRNDPRLEPARRAAAEIEEKLVRVLLREPEPGLADVVLAVDGMSAGPRPWIIAVTPGTPHTLEATAPSGRQWRAEVNGKAGEIVRLEIDVRPVSKDADAVAAPHASRPLATVGIVAGALGIAGIATGAVFGALATSSRADLADAVKHDPQCTGVYPNARCAPAAEARLAPLQDRAFAQSTVSTITFVAGGVLLAGGILMYVLAPSSPPAKTAASSGVRLRIGTGGALEGSF